MMEQDDDARAASKLAAEYLKKHHPLQFPDLTDVSPRITSSFIIQGQELDTFLCTSAIGLTPTGTSEDVKSLPAAIQKVARSIGGSYWRIDLEDEKSYDTDEGLVRLLEIVWPSREQIIRFCSRAHADIGFLSSVSIFHDRPVYTASAETIKKIAYLGGEWGLDIFDYRK
ncbi:MAG: DUF4279 domain-containing protein [Thermoanaerobaculia bacterium]|nr:DUF4279 domain-containing protein [Thermoanaerobaculia bacterium]